MRCQLPALSALFAARLLAAGVLTLGCDGPSRGDAARPPGERHVHGRDGEHGQDHEEADGHSTSAGQQLLRLDPSVLRDWRITTGPIEARTSGETVTALGEIRPHDDRYAEVRAPVPARIVRVRAAIGDHVDEGQPLVELESVELGRTRARLAEARARVDLARRTLERRRILSGDQIVPQREVESAEAELRAAEAERAGLEAVLRAMGALRGTGARFTLRSPLAGTVIDRSTVLGGIAGPDDVLFRVGDVSVLWLVVRAFERDAVRVRQGVSAEVTLPALPGRTIAGRVTRVGSRVDPVSRTIEVRIELANPDGMLRPGMTGSARIPVGDPGERVLAAPSIAVQRCASEWCVFLPRGPGLFEVRTVRRGRDLGEHVEVVSGVEEGEEIIVDGAFLLRAEMARIMGGEAERHED